MADNQATSRTQDIPSTPISTPTVGLPKASATATPTVTVAAVKANPKAAAIEKASTVQTGVFGAYTARIEGLSNASRMRFARLAAYMEGMAPRKPVTELVGAQYQRSLLNVITGIINTAEDFATAFGILVMVVKDNRKGCFADTHIARFTHAMAGSSNERLALVRLLNMLTVLGSVDDVSLAMKQLNMAYVTEYEIDPAGRERLLAWIKG